MDKHFHSERGASLVVVLMILLVLSIVGASVLSVSSSETRFTAFSEQRIKAYQTARAGALAVAEYMLKDPGDATKMIGATSNINTQIGDGTFQVSVMPSVTETNAIEIVSVGKYGMSTQTSKVLVTHTPPGIGGIFKYVLAAKGDIDAGNNAANGITIIGEVATKDGAIDPLLPITDENRTTDHNLDFPAIVIPAAFASPTYTYTSPIMEPKTYTASDFATNLQYVVIPSVDLNNKSFTIETGTTEKIYMRVDGDFSVQNTPMNVTGSGDVHLYVNGNVMFSTNSELNIDEGARLYIYITKNPSTFTFKGRGTTKNLFVYGPFTDIDWQNASSGDLVGALIGNSIKIANHNKVEHNPSLANGVELDRGYAGVTFSGYTIIE